MPVGPSPRNYLVTGVSGAVGWATAKSLLEMGEKVTFLCHTPESGLNVRDKLAHGFGAGPFDLVYCDLSRPESVKEAARRYWQSHPTLDGIAHCAAVFTREREETPEGFERMFATNHLGPFLLTGLLDPVLKASGGGRVVFATAPSTTSLDFDDLQSRQSFNSLSAFGASKMANLLFAYALASRYEGTGCTSNAFFPGLVRSGLMRSASAPIRLLVGVASHSPEKAGSAMARLLTAPEHAQTNGRFYKLDRPTESNAYSRDPSPQRRLWTESERLLGFPSS